MKFGEEGRRELFHGTDESQVQVISRRYVIRLIIRVSHAVRRDSFYDWMNPVHECPPTSQMC